MSKYGVKEMFGNKLCPKCNGPVMMVWRAKGQTFECTNCKDKLAEVPYPVLSSSDNKGNAK